MCKIAHDILHSPIGLNDDVIDAEGDSVRVTMVITRLSDAYSVDIDLWELPTQALPAGSWS
ncbi:acyl carrier protein [Streptomyces bobili]|uniref:acyl carrier protein n=1 Tax=Streptomyces bobili TaxID=67280 RepID=UPI00341566D1